MNEQSPAQQTKPQGEPVYEFDASSGRFVFALEDLSRAASRPKLAWAMIKSGFLSRYQGTALGGLWVTLTTAMTVCGLGLLYGRLFGAELTTYFPYVAIGIVVWGLISSIINEGVSIFLAASGYFNETAIAKSLFPLRVVGIAAIGFLYKVIVIAAVMLFVGRVPGATDLALATLGLILILWTGFWFALGIGTLGARFRDMGQMASAGLTFAFFLTPVFWQSDRLGNLMFIVDFNPLAHYLNVVRGPLLGLPGVGTSFLWAGGCTIAATVFGLLTFGIFARRIVYWS